MATNEPLMWHLEEAKLLAEEKVLPNWHPELKGYAIAYIGKPKLGTRAGKSIMAKIRRASPLESFLSGFEIVLMIDTDTWENLEIPQRTALLDHEFCHVTVELDKAGNEKLVMVGHDLEEFGDVVRRHGVWLPDIGQFAQQLEMRFDG